MNKDFSHPPSEPEDELLAGYAPLSAWEQAQRQARRSPMGYYRTGAVLINRHGEIISTGCAHPSPDGQMVSTHAERHCLSQVPHLDLRGALCLLYTRSSRSGGCSWTSRPCGNCAWALAKRGVQAAVYPRRSEQGLWTVEVDNLRHLNRPGARGQKRCFARALMR